MQKRKSRRQLSVVAILLGLWVSGTVFAATVCTVDGCRGDCDMHKLVLAHEIPKGTCGAVYRAATLTARCTCGAMHAHSAAPATVTAGARAERPEASPLHLAALPAVEPHRPFYARFIGKEPPRRLAALDAPATLGLRAPPAA